MTPLTKIKTAILATSIGAVTLPAVAFATLGAGDTVGVADEDIIAALEADGYTVQSIEVEDDEIEVLAERDNKLWEVEISPETGAILEIELED